MPKTYTPQQKEHALYVINQLGSVAAASRQLDIPQRTLRDWQHAARRLRLLPAKDPLTAYQGEPGSVDVAQIRNRLLTQIDTLTQNLPTDPRQAYFAALAIDRYLDQIRTLNRAIGVRPAPHETHPP